MLGDAKRGISARKTNSCKYAVIFGQNASLAEIVARVQLFLGKFLKSGKSERNNGIGAVIFLRSGKTRKITAFIHLFESWDRDSKREANRLLTDETPDDTLCPDHIIGGILYLEYVVIGDAVLFATDADSIKAANLKANNAISFSAHAMPKFVTIDGTTAAPNEDEINTYNKVLFERHPEFKEMAEKGMMKPFVYFKLVPEVVYYNDYSAGMSPTEVIKL